MEHLEKCITEVENLFKGVQQKEITLNELEGRVREKMLSVWGTAFFQGQTQSKELLL